MTNLVLVINSGSSSLKYQLFDLTTDAVVVKGMAERIGLADSRLVHRAEGASPVELIGELSDHTAALALMLTQLSASGIALDEIRVAGHRVVHGGSLFSRPTVITDEVIAGIESLVPLAPLHNPPALMGIRALQDLMPELQQVAVFDTAFHSTIPAEAYTYPLPTDLCEQYGIRRYGFHGTSHQYVTGQAAKFLGKSVDEVNLIVCHIGNGASVTAVRNGKSVDTSMGLTPLEGLMMGTRSGDVDPGVLFHLARVADFSIEDLDRVLNRESGMLGMTGHSDMREVWDLVDAGDAAAKLAVEVYAYRLRKYISSYLAVVPNLDAVVFTAGVGENDNPLRELALAPMAHLGLVLDVEANNSPSRADRVISTESSPVKLLVLSTNEELEIALLSAKTVAVG